MTPESALRNLAAMVRGRMPPPMAARALAVIHRHKRALLGVIANALYCDDVCDITMPEGVCGAKASILLPSQGGAPREIRTRYCLVSADAIIPSHDPLSFQPDSRYPEGVQERRYNRDRAEQAKVIGIAQTPRPELIFSTSASATDGTPIVTPSGIVLGGNGRSMGLKRAYAQGNGEAFAAFLRRMASAFGFSRSQIEATPRPVVVRTITPPRNEWAKYSRDLNAGLTQALDTTAEAVSLARLVTPSMLSVLSRGLEGGRELGEYLRSKDSLPLIGELEREGVITSTTRGRLVENGLLSKAGRELLIRQFSATMVPDADLLEGLGAAIRNSLARSAPYWMAAAAQGGDWDMRPAFTAAAHDLVAARHAGLAVKDYLRQLSLTNPPQTLGSKMGAMALKILDKYGRSPLKLTRIAKSFASDAELHGGTQVTLLAPLPADESLANALRS